MEKAWPFLLLSNAGYYLLLRLNVVRIVDFDLLLLAVVVMLLFVHVRAVWRLLPYVLLLLLLPAVARRVAYSAALT